MSTSFDWQNTNLIWRYICQTREPTLSYIHQIRHFSYLFVYQQNILQSEIIQELNKNNIRSKNIYLVVYFQADRRILYYNQIIINIRVKLAGLKL